MAVEGSCSILIQCIQQLNTAQDLQIAEQLLYSATEQAKALRNACALGPQNQDAIIQYPNMLNILNTVLYSEATALDGSALLIPFRRMCWQLLANACVQNSNTQAAVWSCMGENLLAGIERPTPFQNIQIMIIYNIFQSGLIVAYDHQILKQLLTVLNYTIKEQQSNDKYEFLHIFLEYFLTKYSRIVYAYAPLDDEKRVLFLNYMADYIRLDSQSGPISPTLLAHLSKEFKKKSDCVLKAVDTYVDMIHPKEVFALIEVISLASGSQMYERTYSADSSLFLNIGALLKVLTSIGKNTKNIFSPKQKLEDVAPNSSACSDFEKEVSFSLRTMLVRALANLLYRNPKNQEYVREMGIITAILECTCVDARNPLIKEWSILAIRNMCENCPGNQEMISSMSKVGDATNDVLKELNLSLGSLRIQPNQ